MPQYISKNSQLQISLTVKKKLEEGQNSAASRPMIIVCDSKNCALIDWKP